LYKVYSECKAAATVSALFNKCLGFVYIIASNLLPGVAGEWIQVDFGRPQHLTGVITQGRGAGTAFGEWVTSFRIAFSDDGTTFRNIKNTRGADQVRNSYRTAMQYSILLT